MVFFRHFFVSHQSHSHRYVPSSGNVELKCNGKQLQIYAKGSGYSGEIIVYPANGTCSFTGKIKTTN